MMADVQNWDVVGKSKCIRWSWKRRVFSVGEKQSEMSMVAPSECGWDGHGALDQFFLQLAAMDGIGFRVRWERGEFCHGKAE